MDKLKKFWAIVIDIWQNGFLEIDIGRIVVACFIFIGFLLLRRILGDILMLKIKLLTKRTKTDWDDNLFESLEAPLRFVPIILGFFFMTEYLKLNENIIIIAEKILRSLIVYNIFWALANLVKPLSFLLRRLEKVVTYSMIDWLIKATRSAFIFIGAATILEIWGIKIGPIIAGFGLFGVAVALGAQDLFKNLISGILVIAEKRFQIGDWIRVDNVVEGTVENIGFRSTLIRRFDKAPVFVPNSKLSDNSMINFSNMTHRRIYWLISVKYHTTVDQLRLVRDQIEEYLMSNDDFAKPPEALLFVRIDRFSDSSIDIMIYCFTKTTNWGAWLKIKEAFAYKIKEIVESAGVGFALPSQSIQFESIPEVADKAEIFIPPAYKEASL